MSVDPLFRMVIQDVFSIAKRGTVVTGTIEAGSLQVGDEVLIRGKGSEKKTVVAGIELFRKVQQQAHEGDSVGILLKDITKSDVARGYEIVSPGLDFSWKP
jgi:elongation factor Tu